MVDGINHDGHREVLQKDQEYFQAIESWRQSTDVDNLAKRTGFWSHTTPWSSPCTSSLRSTLLSQLGKQRASVVRQADDRSASSPRRRRGCATCKRTQGVGYFFAALDLNRDKL